MRIDEASLSNNEHLRFGAFNVFIGGNGVGKTTFVLELFSKATARERSRFYWINEVVFSVPDLEDNKQLLTESLARRYSGSTITYFSQATKDPAGNIDLNGENGFASSEVEALSSGTSDIFINGVKYRRPFIAISSADARLTLPDEVGLTPYNEPAQDAINVLHRSPNQFEEIQNSIQDRFALFFSILSHTGVNLQLGVSRESVPEIDGSDVQENFRIIQDWKDEKFTRLSEAGHGVRSMIRLLTSLLEPVNKVIIIDEPELHLYPSQKVWLGKQLVALARERNKQVFLVTHDPMILQGILDANVQTNIFRIDREADGGSSIKASEVDRETRGIASRSQDQYLQGLFYQRCIVVEGASDRYFYQIMFDEFEDIKDKDLGFVAAGGKGNTKHVVKLATKVGLKLAVIYDYDVILFKPDVVKDVFRLLGGDEATIDVFTAFLHQACIDQGHLRERTNDDRQLNEAITALTSYNRNTGMTSRWSQENKQTFEHFISDLATKGVFIVPNGELESWAPSIDNKVRFAEEAPGIINGNAQLKRDFNDFATKVLGYLGVDTSIELLE